MREGRAVAAGSGAAQRDVGGEAGAQRHLYYNTGRGALEGRSSGSAPGRPESPRAARRASERSRAAPGGPWSARRRLQNSQIAPTRPQRRPRGPKPTRPEPHDGPKKLRRRPSGTPRTAPRAKNCTFPEGFGAFFMLPSFRTKNGPPRPRQLPGSRLDDPREPQEGPPTAQEGPERAPERPKTAQESFQ